MRKILLSFLLLFSTFSLHAMQEQDQETNEFYISHYQIVDLLKRKGFDLAKEWRKAFDRKAESTVIRSKGFAALKEMREAIEAIFEGIADNHIAKTVSKNKLHQTVNSLFRSHNIDDYGSSSLEQVHNFLNTIDNSDATSTTQLDYTDDNDNVSLALLFEALGSSLGKYFNIENVKARSKTDNLLEMPRLYLRVIQDVDRIDIDTFEKTSQAKILPISKREIIHPLPPRTKQEKIWLIGKCAFIIGCTAAVGYVAYLFGGSYLSNLFCNKETTRYADYADQPDPCNDASLTLKQQHQCHIAAQNKHSDFLGKVVTEHQELTSIIKQHCGDTPLKECLSGLKNNAQYAAKYHAVCGNQENPQACIDAYNKSYLEVCNSGEQPADCKARLQKNYDQICPTDESPEVCESRIRNEGYAEYRKICPSDESTEACKARIRGEGYAEYLEICPSDNSPEACKSRIRNEGYAEYRTICPSDESPEACEARIRNEGFQAYRTICPSDKSPEACEARIRQEASADYKRLCPQDTNPNACATRLRNEGYTLVCNNEEAAQDCIIRHEKNGRNGICLANETKEDCAERYNQMMQACPEGLTDQECIQLVNACVNESIDRYKIDTIVKPTGRSRSRGQGYRDNNRLCATGEDLKDLLSPEEIIDFTGGNENVEVCATEEWINNKFGNRAGEIINKMRSIISRN